MVIFFARTEHLPSTLELCRLLPPDWLASWAQRHGEDVRDDTKRQSLGALWLLHLAGGQGNLQYDALGRPFFWNSDAEFNLTHTQGLLFCAYEKSATGRIGIDAESLVRDRDKDYGRLALRWFSPREYACFEASPTPQHFLTLWTRKEAYVKHTGSGLSQLRDADTFSIAEQGALRFLTCRVEDAILSLCLSEDAGTPTQIAKILWNADARRAEISYQDISFAEFCE
ncbi:MAG: 4'-phosphopantetheinyl transferase superfamily protein [Clostridia bacterium]|nr:4'-phosphopantetheinyl transferase superfamily protein [Clostridia bacterium]